MAKPPTTTYRDRRQRSLPSSSTGGRRLAGRPPARAYLTAFGTSLGSSPRPERREAGPASGRRRAGIPPASDRCRRGQIRPCLPWSRGTRYRSGRDEEVDVDVQRGATRLRAWLGPDRSFFRHLRSPPCHQPGDIGERFGSILAKARLSDHLFGVVGQFDHRLGMGRRRGIAPISHHLGITLLDGTTKAP